jgi:hypothetical protein
LRVGAPLKKIAPEAIIEIGKSINKVSINLFVFFLSSVKS